MGCGRASRLCGGGGQLAVAGGRCLRASAARLCVLISLSNAEESLPENKSGPLMEISQTQGLSACSRSPIVCSVARLHWRPAKITVRNDMVLRGD